jgi:hypothetical protein
MNVPDSSSANIAALLEQHYLHIWRFGEFP